MAKVSLRAYNREIETMMDRGHLDEAVAHCRHILKTYSKHLETYRLLGKAYLEQKKYIDAVDIFSRVLVAEPNDFVAHVGMSIIRDEENKLDDAIWHMERAFETQPSNAAIQAELQRLYGRREGIPPPRVRMTRGALAHMYVQGELYPQAISEIKGILKEDGGRSDMQALLAIAYFRNGQKNEAADVAASLLRRYPYCFDANRVLVEILGAERPENAQAYRQRVVELDPYAAQVNGSIFQSGEVSDAAVTLEHLDWNGQPVGMQTDWGTTQAIRVESGMARDEQPDWLRGERSLAETAPPLPPPTHVPAFEEEPAPAQPTSEEDIPEFLRAAGWGKSTGAFDESKSMFADEPEVAPAQPIEQGDLPDWVKAMAPTEAAQPPAEEEEELPDWINKIDASVLGVSAPSETDEQPGWLSGIEPPSQPEAQIPEDQPDWLKQFDQPEASQPVLEDQPDWLKEIAAEAEAAPYETPADQPDWLGQLDEESQGAPASQAVGEFDFLDEPVGEPEQTAPAAPESAKIDTGSLGTSEQDRDDSFAWLESLAAKQGASEGLLTKPEERLEEEPEWVKQAKSLSGVPTMPPVAQPAANIEDLGKSEQERDDSFAWLESLAAKQGASEGLLTKPEERLEEEPEWVKQAKGLKAVEEPPTQPGKETHAPVEETDAWLQDGTEDEALTEKDSTGVWLKSLEEMEAEAAQPVQEEAGAVTDTAAWLRSLDEEEKPETEPVKEETEVWWQSLDEAQATPAQPEAAEELPAWMQNVEVEAAPATEPAVPAEEATGAAEWRGAVEESVIQQEASSLEAEELPTWLSGLGQEEEKTPPIPATDELPAWLREEEAGEPVAEPPSIEPTREEEWKPLVEEQPEVLEPAAEEAVMSQPAPAVERAEPAPVMTQPAPEPAPKEAKPAKPAPYKEPATRKGTGTLKMPVDMLLGQARNDLSRSNLPGALETYSKLIKKGRFLDEIIFDLREALYRFPVEVSIWQTLGDAYMRDNRLQDALDAYTKAEELLR